MRSESTVADGIQRIADVCEMVENEIFDLASLKRRRECGEEYVGVAAGADYGGAAGYAGKRATGGPVTARTREKNSRYDVKDST